MRYNSAKYENAAQLLKSAVLFFSLSAALSASAWAQSAAPPLPVFVFAGQSNMVGTALITDLTAAQAQPQPNVFYWYPVPGPWNIYQPNYQDGLGPELTAGQAIAGPLGTQVGMVKLAAGGTSLAVDWNPATPGSLFSQTVDRVNLALSALTTQQGIQGKVAGFFWMQGEADSTDPVMANNYEANLTNFIAQVRSAFGDPNLPFIIGQISTYSGWTYGDIVRTAELNVAAQVPHVGVFDTADLTRWPTNPAHYDTQGIIQLGYRFAGSYLSLQSGSQPHNQSVTALMASPSSVSVAPGQVFNLTYNFQGGPTSTSLTAFVHFVNSAGAIAFQDTHLPPTPTNQWSGNISYTRSITVQAALPADNYKIFVGLYDPATGARSTLNMGPGVTTDGQLRYQVGTLSVGAAPPITMAPAAPRLVQIQ